MLINIKGAMATNDPLYAPFFVDKWAAQMAGDVGFKRVQQVDEKGYVYPTIVVRSIFFDMYIKRLVENFDVQQVKHCHFTNLHRLSFWVLVLIREQLDCHFPKCNTMKSISKLHCKPSCKLLIPFPTIQKEMPNMLFTIWKINKNHLSIRMFSNNSNKSVD